jgi:cysteine-rich repeat protein
LRKWSSALSNCDGLSASGDWDSCAFGLLDSFLELLDENGDSLAADDDGGDGFCARIVLANLPVGHYTARVAASPAGDTPTFPYRLLVFTDICGNGKKTPAEECDDGNVEAGDGCSATCRSE